MTRTFATSKKYFNVQRDENIIDNVRNRVAAYEDSVRHHYEMVEYKDSIANQVMKESNGIKRMLESRK